MERVTITLGTARDSVCITKLGKVITERCEL
jgi:hypothetical protein